MSAIRYSSTSTRGSVPKSTAADNKALFEEALAGKARGPWILLVGGSDLASMRIRHAQANVRFDARPSYFSHAAIVLDPPAKETPVEAATGVEVALAPAPGQVHLPERNGVTFFELARYLDSDLFPNVAVIAATGEAPKDDVSEAKIRAAALARNPGRGRHSFLPWIARWSAWALTPETLPNPLLENAPMPSAVFCDYVFATAGLDIIPSASSPALTPEHLWASAKHFGEALGKSLGDAGGRGLWVRIGDPLAAYPPADSTSPEEAYGEFRKDGRS